MSKLTVTNTTKGVVGIGKVILQPGENSVDVDEWALAVATSSVAKKVASGIYIVETPPASESRRVRRRQVTEVPVERETTDEDGNKS